MIGEVSVALIAGEWTFPGGDVDCTRVDMPRRVDGSRSCPLILS